jgi:S-adenosylmethionine decarboxylase
MSTTQNAVGEEPPGKASSQGVQGYGPHLTYDGYGADPARLNDMKAVFEFLLKIPVIIGMQRLTQPYVMSYDGGDVPTDYGVTGIVIIATSHISIHTYPHDRTFFLDIFSCKWFDREKALAFIREAFGTEHEAVELVVRGKRFRER